MTSPPTFVVFPDPGPPELLRTLDMAGMKWIGISADDASRKRAPDVAISGAVVVVSDDDGAGWSVCRDIRKWDTPVEAILVLAGGGQLGELRGKRDLFEDFLITPFHPTELEARLEHVLFRAGLGVATETVDHGPLEINLETYQAVLNGRLLDLTYMEYELLKFLATNPDKVFTRETLLSRVWGYEYFGGARTVDVHIRRLRAKFGEEYAQMIQTVRSVGYKLSSR